MAPTDIAERPSRRTRVLNPGADGADLGHEVERVLMAGIGITALALGLIPSASDLTLSQWRVLVIASHSDRLRIGELAVRLGTAVPSASRLVRRIETRGFVRVSRADDDRRVTLVHVTDRGRRIVDDVMSRRRELIRDALGDDFTSDAKAASTVKGVADRLARFI